MEQVLKILSDPKPFDHKALLDCIQCLIKKYSFLEFNYLGNSILGRGIPLLRLGTGSRKVLYVGAHHAMEWITSLVLMHFVKDFCEGVAYNGHFYNHRAKQLLQDCSFYIVPMLNPDGVEYQIHGISSKNPIRERVIDMNNGSENFKKWQANARGVDLNHNYDFKFAEYKDMEIKSGILKGSPTRFSGEAPESEPEVASLCNFIRFQDRLSGVLTLHTQGKEIYFQGGEKIKYVLPIAQKISQLTGYQIARPHGQASYGGLTDWCIGHLNIPSFTLECGQGINPLPLSDFLPIYTNLRRLLFTFPTFL